MGKPPSLINDDKNAASKQAAPYIKCPCEKEVYAKTTADCKKICDAFKSDKEDASIFADTVLLRALNTGSPSIEFSIKQPEKTNTDARTKPSPGSSNFILSLSSNDNSHEFNELWVYKKKNQKTLAIFSSPNPSFKPNGSFYSGFVKPFKAAIDSAAGTAANVISVLVGSRTINVTMDGTWSDWYLAGTHCFEDENCLLGIFIKGVQYNVLERLRFIMPNAPFTGISLTGYANIEIEHRFILNKCGCKN
jgi:hypothetical protein